MRRSSCLLSLLTLVTVAASGGIGSALEPDQAVIDADVVYGHKDGLALTMDVIQPSTGNGAGILFMVSGGWFSKWSPPGGMAEHLEPYLKEGYTVFAVRHGSSPRYALPEIVADVRQSVRFVRQNAAKWNLEPHRLGAMGYSAGGHLALMLATTGDDGDEDADDEIERVSSRVAAVVAMVPPTDLRVAVWEAPESLPVYRNFPALDLPLEKAAEHSPVVHVTKDDAPALVMMGGADELVPAKHGKWIDAAYEEAGVSCELIVFPEAGHNVATPKNKARVLDEAIGWFDAHLQVGEKPGQPTP